MNHHEPWRDDILAQTLARLRMSPTQRLEAATPLAGAFLPILRQILAAGIRVALVGSAGEAAQGSLKPVGDFDLLVQTGSDDLVRIASALYDAGMRLDLRQGFFDKQCLVDVRPDAPMLGQRDPAPFVRPVADPQLRVDVFQTTPIMHADPPFWGSYGDLDPSAFIDFEGRRLPVPSIEQSLLAHQALMHRLPVKEHGHRAAITYLEIVMEAMALDATAPASGRLGQGQAGDPGVTL